MLKEDNYIATNNVLFNLAGLEKFFTEEELKDLKEKLCYFIEFNQNMSGVKLKNQLEKIVIYQIKEKTTQRLTAIKNLLSFEKEEQPLFDMAEIILDCGYDLKNLELSDYLDENIIKGYANLLETGFGLADDDAVAKSNIDRIMHNGTNKKLYDIEKASSGEEYFNSTEALEAKCNYLNFLLKYNIGMKTELLKRMGYSEEFLQKISTERLEKIRKTLNFIYGNHIARAQEIEALAIQENKGRLKKKLTK